MGQFEERERQTRDNHRARCALIRPDWLTVLDTLRLSKECGFDVGPHRFRHTLVTELMKASDCNLQIARIVGTPQYCHDDGIY